MSFGCFGEQIDGPGLPGGLIIYHGHLFPLKGHLCSGYGPLGRFQGKPERTSTHIFVSHVEGIATRAES